MKVWHFIPYSTEKNLGKAYNEYMNLIPDNDSACFTDGDSMQLLPNWGHVIQTYAEQNPNAVLTCWVSRLHELAKGQNAQLVSGDVKEALKAAQYYQKEFGYNTTPIRGSVSGTLMLIPERIWKAHPFGEKNVYRPNEPNLLGCDNEWTNRIRAAGVPILRMDGLIVYHQYRLLQGTKTHLL